MIEPNLMGSRKKQGSNGLDITFELSAVGSRTLIDASPSKRVFTRTAIAGTPPVTDGVIDHPVFGKCYRFNGYTYFNCTDILQFSKGDYRIELDFVPNSNGRTNTVFRSGDYNSQGIRPGLLLTLNQFPANYFQAFCPYAAGFTRAFLENQTNPGLAMQVLEQMVITKKGTSLTIENKRTGAKTTTTIVPAATDTYLAFGASDDLTTTYSLDGLLKRFQLFIT